jgi:hypothetical protein
VVMMFRQLEQCITTIIIIIGDTLSIEAITPHTVFMSPPGKLVLEIKSSGGYRRARWSKVEDPGFSPSHTSFVHFGEVYYVERTTLADLGRYSVHLEPLPGQTRSPAVIFDVILHRKYVIEF